MMSLMNKLLPLKEALLAVSDEQNVPVYHYWRPGSEPKYILWEELNEISSLETDNHKGEQAVDGTVDYYTFEEFDPVFDEIQNALNGVENLQWEYDGTDYEDETKYIHHNWVWRIF